MKRSTTPAPAAYLSPAMSGFVHCKNWVRFVELLFGFSSPLSRSSRPFGLYGAAVLKPYSRPLRLVCRDEFHASRLKCPLNFPQCLCGASYLRGSFKAPNRSHVHRCSSGQIGLVYVQQSTSSPNLGTVNHAPPDLDSWLAELLYFIAYRLHRIAFMPVSLSTEVPRYHAELLPFDDDHCNFAFAAASRTSPSRPLRAPPRQSDSLRPKVRRPAPS
jgi:hypothetical protein